MKGSGHLNLIDYLRNDFLTGDITCLSLIGKTDTMAQHIMCHGTDILGYDIPLRLIKA